MKVPVVISTGIGRGQWVGDCIGSISRGNVTICRSDGGGELGAIRMIYEGTHWRRWLMLQDSTVVLDQGLFDLVDAVEGPCLLAPHPAMYLAVYERSVLDVVGIPEPAAHDREAAIALEVPWMRAYEAQCHAQGFACPVLFPELTDDNATGQVEHNGRVNLIVENRYLRKYKGTWR